MQTKIHIPADKNLVFVSDLHIQHSKPFIYSVRGFNSIGEHDAYLFSELEAIANQDTVFVNLGDPVFGDPQHVVFDRLAELPFFKHYFIWGNHSSGSKQAYNEALESVFKYWGSYFQGEVYPIDYKHITFVGYQAFFKYRKQTIFGQHFPLEIWDDMTHGAIHCCGHSHSSFDKTNGSRTDCGKILDVGVDTALKFWQKPYWTFDQVKGFMDQRPVVSKGHH